MDAADRESLKREELVFKDSDGDDAVRVYLEYLDDLAETSPTARRTALRGTFEDLVRSHPEAHVRLDPGSLSETGQVIEAVVPVDRLEDLERECSHSGVRVQLVRTYDAT